MRQSVIKHSPEAHAKESMAVCLRHAKTWIYIARCEGDAKLRSQAISTALMKRKHANQWRRLIKVLEGKS